MAHEALVNPVTRFNASQTKEKLFKHLNKHELLEKETNP
jgi:hypothetical protein